jgi:hypothetical protein
MLEIKHKERKKPSDRQAAIPVETSSGTIFVSPNGQVRHGNGKFVKGCAPPPTVVMRSRTRAKLTQAFIEEMCEDFEEHGKSAIQACRIFSPDVYIRVIAAMLPKQVVTSQEQSLSDDELNSALTRLLASDINSLAATREGRDLPYIEGTAIEKEQE